MAGPCPFFLWTLDPRQAQLSNFFHFSPSFTLIWHTLFGFLFKGGDAACLPSAESPLKKRTNTWHSISIASRSHMLMHTWLPGCERVCASVVFKQSERLMNLLCSDWKLIKTASNRRPPTGSRRQHADRQTAARQIRARLSRPSDALPAVTPFLEYSCWLFRWWMSESSLLAAGSRLTSGWSLRLKGFRTILWNYSPSLAIIM